MTEPFLETERTSTASHPVGLASEASRHQGRREPLTEIMKLSPPAFRNLIYVMRFWARFGAFSSCAREKSLCRCDAGLSRDDAGYRHPPFAKG